MLKKLINHEFKATRRFFLPAYAIFTALLILERLSLLAAPAFEESEGFLGAIAGITITLVTAITIIFLIALMVAPAIYGIVRFYRNMLGDEGYLTFTLPVTTGQLIWSKLLVTVFWEIVTALVIILIGGSFVVSLSFEEFAHAFREVGKVFGDVWDQVGGWAILTLITLLGAMILQMFSQMLMVYNCLSIGQTAGKHRLLASAGCYVGMNFITSWLIQIPLTILMFILDGEWFTEFDRIMTNAMESGEYVVFCQIFILLLLLTMVANLILGTVHYLMSRYFLTKKLNLA